MASKTDVQGSDEIDWDNHEFIEPKKEITDPADIHNKWEKSEAYQDMMGFIVGINSQLKGKKMRDEIQMSETCKKILELLETLDKWIDETPPLEQPQRFGNKAFRDWFDKLTKESESLLKGVLPEKFHPAVKEISIYLIESVGNKTRIDYGTGHEFAFVAFLCCLFKVGALESSDAVAVGLKVFQRYLELMRRLQTTYRMEPAGSHGVFSLDDYHFMPFLWGSAQLVDHPRIKPCQFVEPDYYTSFDKDFMFLSAIRYITQVKTGVFAEHSNQLWNISGVPFWSKVNSGLIKMYKVEVLGKFPVIQHFLFGSLLSVTAAKGPLKHSPHMPTPSPGHTPMATPSIPIQHSGSDGGSPYKHTDTPFPEDMSNTSIYRDSPYPVADGSGGYHHSRAEGARHGVRPRSTHDVLVAGGTPPMPPPPAPTPFSVDPTLIRAPGAMRNPVMDPTVAKALKTNLPPVPKPSEDRLRKAADTEFAAKPMPDKKGALKPLDHPSSPPS